MRTRMGSLYKDKMLPEKGWWIKPPGYRSRPPPKSWEGPITWDDYARGYTKEEQEEMAKNPLISHILGVASAIIRRRWLPDLVEDMDEDDKHEVEVDDDGDWILNWGNVDV